MEALLLYEWLMPVGLIVWVMASAEVAEDGAAVAVADESDDSVAVIAPTEYALLVGVVACTELVMLRLAGMLSMVGFAVARLSVELETFVAGMALVEALPYG